MIERESYTVALNGAPSEDAVGLSRPEALGFALEVLDGPDAVNVVQVDIIEEETREPRASWRRHGPCWFVTSVPAWLA